MAENTMATTQQAGEEWRKSLQADEAMMAGSIYDRRHRYVGTAYLYASLYRYENQELVDMLRAATNQFDTKFAVLKEELRKAPIDGVPTDEAELWQHTLDNLNALAVTDSRFAELRRINATALLLD